MGEDDQDRPQTGVSTTREEIVTAAAKAFTASGYEGTSMRQVAVGAGVDPALVRRFFGDKEQSFGAVFQPEHAVPLLLAGPRGRLGERLVTYMLSRLGEVERPSPLLGLMRSAATSEHAATLIREFLANDMLGKVTRELRMDRPELRAALAAGQLLGLAIARSIEAAHPTLPVSTTPNAEPLVRQDGVVRDCHLQQAPS